MKNYFRDNKTFEKNNREIELTENIVIDEVEISTEKNIPLIVLQKELEKFEDWERILLLMRSQDMPNSKISEFVNKPENQLKEVYLKIDAETDITTKDKPSPMVGFRTVISCLKK